MSTGLEQLITSYGYWALLVGTFLEGETILVLAGFLAHRGFLSLPLVILVALAGSFAGDQLFFFIGRNRGSAFLKKRPHWQQRVERVNRLLQRHPLLIVLGFRFVYGLRTATPLVIGASAFPTWRFVALNFLGALAWSAVIGSAGYLFGQALELLLSDLRRYEMLLAGGLLLAGALIWLVRRMRQRNRS